MKKAEVHFITGGQRSGKSAYAEALALSKSDAPIYLATSKIWDDEYKKRVDQHRARRDHRWTTIEEEKNIAKLHLEEKVVLLDCITLWLTNLIDVFEYNTEKALEFAKEQWLQFLKKDMSLIVVGNEIGMGVIPFEKATRGFVDIHGELNQWIAKSANEVTLLVSGIPMKVKG